MEGVLLVVLVPEVVDGLSPLDLRPERAELDVVRPLVGPRTLEVEGVLLVVLVPEVVDGLGRVAAPLLLLRLPLPLGLLRLPLPLGLGLLRLPLRLGLARVCLDLPSNRAHRAFDWDLWGHAFDEDAPVDVAHVGSRRLIRADLHLDNQIPTGIFDIRGPCLRPILAHGDLDVIPLPLLEARSIVERDRELADGLVLVALLLRDRAETQRMHSLFLRPCSFRPRLLSPLLVCLVLSRLRMRLAARGRCLIEVATSSAILEDSSTTDVVLISSDVLHMSVVAVVRVERVFEVLGLRPRGGVRGHLVALVEVAVHVVSSDVVGIAHTIGVALPHAGQLNGPGCKRSWKVSLGEPQRLSGRGWRQKATDMYIHNIYIYIYICVYLHQGAPA